jgi:phosphoglycolate phosphatase
MSHPTRAGVRYRAIILDLDGTMVDTIGDFVAALNAALRSCALSEVQPDSVRRWIGRGGEHLLRQAMLNAGRDAQDDALFNALRAGFYQHYGVINGQHAAVFDGVAKGLQQWQDQGVRLACVTNKPEAHAKDLLDKKWLASFFDTRVWGGDTLPEKKPHPMALLAACAHMGVAPHETLMVGDSQTDHGAALAANMDVALLSWGYNHDQDVRDLEAAFHGDHFAALVDFTATAT